MSDAMFAAIKARKMKPSVMGDHVGDHNQDHAGVSESDNRPVTDFVAKLNDGQKEHLKKLLGAKDGPQDQSQNISRGYASTEEQGKIEQKMNQSGPSAEETENENTGGDIDHDGIAKSMLDSRYRNGPPAGVKPRNLNERMKMHVAGQLKEKGKL